VAPYVVIPMVELLVFDTAYVPRGTVMSFANSVLTTDGGSHVEKAYDLIIPPILDKVNEVQPKVTKKLNGRAARLAAAKKSRTRKSDGIPKKQLRKMDVKPLMSFILSVHVKNPFYSGQTKTKLEVEMSPLPPDEKLYKKITSMDMMDDMKGLLNALKLHALSATDGRKVKNIKLKHGFDANLSGTDRSHECVLWIVEGKSALAYAVALLSLVKNGRDLIGIYPVRGKFLNLSKAEPMTIINNPEVTMLKKLLGLKEGRDYTEDENYKSLRYGRIMTMTDADVDGGHIKGLIFNFFFVLHPSLILINYIVDYRTKYLRASKGKTKQNFYTQFEFEDWKKENSDWNTWKFDYYKGLGTSESEDVKEDSLSPLTVELFADEHTAHMFRLAFSKTKNKSNMRKDWARTYMESKDKGYVITDKMSYTTFFNKEFIVYIMESLDRAIPNASDGLKRCHRQILHAIFKKWPTASGASKYKVAQFSGYIATCVEYQHNEECLSKTIINMAREYVGANNLRLLMDRGQFGTRMFAGDDHSAPRYIYTHSTKWPYLVFRKEDGPILDYHDDDGVKVEPRRFYPIIPWALINGIQGVATAYSTTIFPYNPIEVVNYTMVYIYNKYMVSDSSQKIPLVPLVPWFKGFTGIVSLEKDIIKIDEDDEVVLTKEYNPDNEEDDSDDEDHEDREDKERAEYVFGGRCDRVTIKGLMDIHPNGKDATIREIPVGRALVSYGYDLQCMREDKILSSYTDNSTKDVVHFEIRGMQNPTYKKLKLIRKIRLSNMVLLGEDDIPIRFRNTEEYITYFVGNRYVKYHERHAYKVKDLENDIEILNNRILFLKAITEGKLEVRNRSKVDIMRDMDSLGIRKDILKKAAIYDLTKEKLEKVIADLDSKMDSLNVYKNTSPVNIWYNELTELRVAMVAEGSLTRSIPGIVIYPKQPTRPDETPSEEVSASNELPEVSSDKQ
jgi:DNA topoisomerase-2